MDSKRKQELLVEIASVAPKMLNKSESNLTLLDLMKVYNEVLSAKKINPDSPEAIDLYKTMLKMGRVCTWKSQLKSTIKPNLSSSSLCSSKEESKRCLGKGSNTDSRTPLNNLTNKATYAAVFSDDNNVPTFRSNKIELPKLQLTNLLKKPNKNEEITFSIDNKIKASDDGDSISELEIKLAKLQKQPAEKDCRHNKITNLNEIIASNFYRKILLRKVINLLSSNKLQTERFNNLLKIARTSYKKHICKKALRVLNNQAKASYTERIYQKSAIQKAEFINKKKCIKSWYVITQKLIVGRLVSQRILEKCNAEMKARCFNLLKERYNKRKKAEMNENIANFKHSQKIAKASLRSLAIYSVKKKLFKILSAKSNKMNWIRLATLGFALFFKNSIRVKEIIGIEAKVSIGIINRLMNTK